MPGGAETEEPEIPEGMTVDDTSKRWSKIRRGKGGAARLIPKEKFKGTPNLEKLGVKVEGSVADYRFVDSMLAANKAAGSVQRELKNAERRLRPTEAERDFASESRPEFTTRRAYRPPWTKTRLWSWRTSTWPGGRWVRT